MSQNKNVSRKVLIAVAVGVIVVFAVVGVIAAYWHAELTAPPEATPTPAPGAPSLVSSDLHCYDNRTDATHPFVHVTGTVTNTGDATANSCTVHLTATRAGGEVVIDTTQAFESLEPGESATVDMNFEYTGDALQTTNAELDWTN